MADSDSSSSGSRDADAVTNNASCWLADASRSQQSAPRSYSVSGKGFDPIGGGFSHIVINDVEFPVARIVRCVNAHDELVASLEAIEMETRQGGQWCAAEKNEEARAALAEATGSAS